MKKLKQFVIISVIILPLIIFIINLLFSIFIHNSSIKVSFLSTIPFTYLRFDAYFHIIIFRYCLLVIALITIILFLFKKKKIFLITNLLLCLFFISDLIYFINMLSLIVTK